MCKNQYPENTRLRHISLNARKMFVGYYSFFLFIKYIRLIIKHFLQYNISNFCYYHFLLLHNIVLTFCLTLMFVLITLWFNYSPTVGVNPAHFWYYLEEFNLERTSCSYIYMYYKWGLSNWKVDCICKAMLSHR